MLYVYATESSLKHKGSSFAHWWSLEKYKKKRKKRTRKYFIKTVSCWTTVASYRIYYSLYQISLPQWSERLHNDRFQYFVECEKRWKIVVSMLGTMRYDYYNLILRAASHFLTSLVEFSSSVSWYYVLLYISASTEIRLWENQISQIIRRV